MIPGAQYYTVFLIFLTVLALIKSIPMGDKNILSPDVGSNGFNKGLILAFILVLYFGFRPIGTIYLGDTNVYADEYNLIKLGVFSPDFRTITSDGDFDFNSEFMFYYTRNLFANLGLDVWLWFAYVAAIYVVLPLIAFRILMPHYEYLAMLYFMSGFTFFTGGVNGIRNADGNSIFLLGLALIAGRNPQLLLGGILCAISYYFHHSLAICLIGLIGSYFVVKDTKSALFVWFAAIIMSLVAGNYLANIATALFGNERVSDYMNGATNSSLMQSFSHTGFRWDFIVYSSMPIWLGWYVTIKKAIKDKSYQLLLNTYILANAVWIVFIYASYSNRFAMLSWSLYPIVLCYPLVKFNIWGDKQASRTALILFAQVLFQIIF